QKGACSGILNDKLKFVGQLENDGKKKMMKRGLVTTFVFGAALVIVASNHGTTARLHDLRAAQVNLFGPQTATSDELREEFHRSVLLAANGRVSIENLNGGVRISV